MGYGGREAELRGGIECNRIVDFIGEEEEEDLACR